MAKIKRGMRGASKLTAEQVEMINRINAEMEEVDPEPGTYRPNLNPCLLALHIRMVNTTHFGAASW